MSAGRQFERLYRAQVRMRSGAMLTVFVEASAPIKAATKATKVVAVIEGSEPYDVADRVDEAASAAQCIERGLSPGWRARLLEIGRITEGGIEYVERPVILLTDPLPLLRAWCRAQLRWSADSLMDIIFGSLTDR